MDNEQRDIVRRFMARERIEVDNFGLNERYAAALRAALISSAAEIESLKNRLELERSLSKAINSLREESP